MKTRNTTQRIKILQYLKGVKTHPNAELVYEHVKKDLPSITLATVYRNLNLLADHGDVLRFKVKNEYRFDADISQHQHCICTDCGCVKDVFQKEISEYALNKFKGDDFFPASVNVMFYGNCKDCKEVV